MSSKSKAMKVKPAEIVYVVEEDDGRPGAVYDNLSDLAGDFVIDDELVVSKYQRVSRGTIVASTVFVEE